MKEKRMAAVKNSVCNWWERNKQKCLSFSISARYVLIVLVFLFAWLGSMNFCGFGVDSEGKLYVGRKAVIEVYLEGEQVAILSTPFQKTGWNMGVSPDNHILATGSGIVFTMQLDGTVIGEEEDINSMIGNSLKKQRLIEGNDGKQYRLRHKWIWPTITQNGKVIYAAPIVDVLGRIAFMLYFLFFLPDLVCGAEKIRKKRSEKSHADGGC